ncbi:hypothetical protein [Bradyrhizobium lablabi]|uniref:hypothetical protein n=1 Tax=Bradyrhizobium lablabi TaxID=722472 RepID=UPI001BAC06C9|nr:hypothetical protein [Bradyrhizobium lablabi]MBR0697771.1 hypothetical protein [Bradyrhizobium lablabi]
MDKRSLGLLVAALTVLPDVAQAGGWGYVTYPYPGVYPGFLSARDFLGYRLDDSFDEPVGYGEYAEYGPWANPNRAGCRTVAGRVLTPYGWNNVIVRTCR